MKRISYYIFALLSFVGAALQSCTDEIQYPNGGDVEKIPEGITLRIPDPAGLAATRATTDTHAGLVGEEGKINSLWIAAFPTGSNTNGKIIQQISGTAFTPSGNDPLTEHKDLAQGYKDFNITDFFKDGNTVKTGTYNIYVVANLEKYLPSGIDLSKLESKSDFTEEDFKAIALNFVKKEAGKDDVYLLSLANGLPMACRPNEMLVRTGNNDLTQSNNGIDITNGDMLIHADLTILATKVRCTLLFDASGNTNGKGFEAEMFKDMTFDLTTAQALKLDCNGTTIGGQENGTVMGTRPSLGFSEYGFPDLSTFPATPFQALGVKSGSPFERRAYSAILYLPANQQTEDNKSYLFFKGNIKYKKEGTNDVENGATLSYTLPLVPKEVEIGEGKSSALVAGHAYDIVAKMTGVDKLEDVKVEVVEWTIDQLKYELMPPCYLDVDKVEVPVIAGKDAEINYTTNAAPLTLSCKSVEVDGEQVPLYVLDTQTAGVAKIGINSKIPTSKFTSITDDDYKYFYLNAGQIHKKISVSPLTLQRFLTVSPKEITIDAREKIASYDYGGRDKYVDIEIDTNIESFTLKTSNWKNNSAVNYLYLENMNTGQKIWTSGNGDITVNKVGTTVLRLYYEGLNKPNVDYWETDHSMSFTVEVENTVTHGSGYIAPQKVTVTANSKTDNYTIYLKHPWSGVPHIYVYQCLELPATIGSKTLSRSENKTFDLSNYPVGYKDGTNYYAALEYLFSGSIAFKGWEDSGNKDYLKDTYMVGSTNEGILNGWVEGGFFMFNGNGSKYCDWNPNNDTDGVKKHFNKDIDFNLAHRKLLEENNQKDCNCYNTISNGWPGIRMLKITDEDDPNYGWWKYELSSLATPGKTLIMFTSKHDGSNDRWPEDSKVGIALFDYKSRIGYYDIDKKYFTQTRDGQVTETFTRIYFDNSKSNFSQPYIYMWKTGNGENATWPGVAMTKDAVSGLWYYDKPDKESWDQMIFNGGNDNGKSLDLTYNPANNKYDKDGAAGNYNGNSGNGGGQGETSEYVTYRFYWYKKYNNIDREYIHVYELPTGTKKNNADIVQPKTYYRDSFNESDGFCYFEFDVPKNSHESSFTWKFILHEAENGWSNRIDLDMKSSDFSKNGSIYELKKTTGY